MERGEKTGREKNNTVRKVGDRERGRKTGGEKKNTGRKVEDPLEGGKTLKLKGIIYAHINMNE